MRSSLYHPQTNGQPKRFNRTLMTILGSLSVEHKINWQDWVSNLTHAYNCTSTRVTGFSPYYLMFGREPRIPVDEEFGVTLPKTRQTTIKQYVETLHKHLQWAYKIAKEHIEKDVACRKLYYDRKVHCMDILKVTSCLLDKIKKYLGPHIRLRIEGKSQYTRSWKNMMMICLKDW